MKKLLFETLKMSNPTSPRKRFVEYDEDDIHIIIKQKPGSSTTRRFQPSRQPLKKSPSDDEQSAEENDKGGDIKNFSIADLMPMAGDIFREAEQVSTNRTDTENEEILFTRSSIVKRLTSIERLLKTVAQYKLVQEKQRGGTASDVVRPPPQQQEIFGQPRIAGKHFPLNETEDFVELENNITESREMEEEFSEYLRSLKPMLDSSERDTFRSLFTDYCIYGFSWNGTRTDVQDSITFKELLHKEWYPELSNDDYVRTVRLLIDRSRKRHGKLLNRMAKENELEEQYKNALL